MDSLATRAEAALEASRNAWVLSNAAHEFQQHHNAGRIWATPKARAAELAERYFLRAKALNPTLDREKILPKPDTKAIARALEAEQRAITARFEEASRKIQRLPLEAFPELPPAVAEVLRQRNCRIPQPYGAESPRNVIRGEFFEKGETGWAVLCSVDGSSTLLAFRHDQDSNPAVIAEASQDMHHLQGLGGDTIGYSRQIAAVGRDVIMRFYRAFGGPEPPPIDHHGIDDAFLGKASVIRYFYEGEWLALQGAD